MCSDFWTVRPSCLPIAVAVGLSLVTVSPAGARVPSFKGTAIVTGTSIGGVKVGMSKAQAAAVWGRPDRCSAPDQYGTSWCQYLGVSTLQGGYKVNQPFAGFYVRKGKVIVVNLESAENTAIDPKVKRFKTSKNVRIGSKLSDARRKYGIPAPSGGEAALSNALFRQGKRCTKFFAPSAPYKIEAISVGLCSTNHGLDGGLS